MTNDQEPMTKQIPNLCVLVVWLIVASVQAVNAQAPAGTLTVGAVQIGLEPTLEASRDKILRFVGEAKDRGCRVVVFPETSLFWPPQTPKAEIDAAAEVVRKAVDAADVYALVKPFERLLVIDPEGRIVQSYNKMWGDARFNDCPGVFQIDGVPCCAAICADRWIRSVEELPAMAGASTCGRAEAMLMTPRSLARSPAPGRTCVMSAKSTAW